MQIEHLWRNEKKLLSSQLHNINEDMNNEHSQQNIKGICVEPIFLISSCLVSIYNPSMYMIVLR